MRVTSLVSKVVLVGDAEIKGKVFYQCHGAALFNVLAIEAQFGHDADEVGRNTAGQLADVGNVTFGQ